MTKPLMPQETNPMPTTDLPTAYRRALACLRANRPQQAIPLLRACLDHSSRFPEAGYYLGLALMLSGQVQDSLDRLRQAVDGQPGNPVYLCNLGEACRRAGLHEEAERYLLRALQHQPNYAHARHNLARTYLSADQARKALRTIGPLLRVAEPQARDLNLAGDAWRSAGNPRAAVRAYRKVLKLEPQNVHALSNLGPLLLTLGQIDEALSLCRQAVELDPDNGLAHMNLGRCLAELEQYDQAMNAFADAYERIPNHTLLLNSMASVWVMVHELAQAEYWFLQVLEHEPDNIRARCGLADVHREAGLLDEALETLNELERQYPNEVQVLLSRAAAWEEEGDMEACVADYRRVLELRPKVGNYHALLGNALEIKGDLTGAEREFRTALRKNPRQPAALAGLATLLRGRLPAQDANTMEELLQHPDLGERPRSRLHSGLAYYYDGIREFARAAEHMEQGNRLFWKVKQRQGWSYDADAHSRFVDQLMAVFDREYMARIAATRPGHESDKPLFVLGMPRSGTTLTEQILASHPEIMGVGERPYANQSFHSLPNWLHSTAKTLDLVPHLQAKPLRQIAQWHLQQLQQLENKWGKKQPARRIVDKMPDNYLLIGWIMTLFPNARIIYAQRDVRDVALSCWMTQFARLRWAFDQTHIARRIVDHLRIMRHWQALMREFFPDQWLETSYEALVTDPETKIRQLVAFAGVEWDERCLQHHRQTGNVRTASVVQVRKPIYKGSVKRWENYADALRPLLEQLEAAGF